MNYCYGVTVGAQMDIKERLIVKCPLGGRDIYSTKCSFPPFFEKNAFNLFSFCPLQVLRWRSQQTLSSKKSRPSSKGYQIDSTSWKLIEYEVLMKFMKFSNCCRICFMKKMISWILHALIIVWYSYFAFVIQYFSHFWTQFFQFVVFVSRCLSVVFRTAAFFCVFFEKKFLNHMSFFLISMSNEFIKKYDNKLNSVILFFLFEIFKKQKSLIIIFYSFFCCKFC